MLSSYRCGSVSGDNRCLSTAAIAGSIKAKDEVTLEYKLDSVQTSETVISDKNKSKASADGEDVITPMVSNTAERIVSLVKNQQLNQPSHSPHASAWDLWLEWWTSNELDTNLILRQAISNCLVTINDLAL